MALNIEKVLERGERLDTLEERAGELSSSAQMFTRLGHLEVLHYYSCTNVFMYIAKNCKPQSYKSS